MPKLTARPHNPGLGQGLGQGEILFARLSYQDFSLAQTGIDLPERSRAPVAPLAQTGMTRTTHLPKAVAPGRAGRALRSK